MVSEEFGVFLFCELLILLEAFSFLSRIVQTILKVCICHSFERFQIAFDCPPFHFPYNEINFYVSLHLFDEMEKT